MWFFNGLILASIILLIVFTVRKFNIHVSWYEWLIASFGTILIVFAIQNYSASIAEFEPVAPRMFLLLFGLPGFGLILVSIGLVVLRWYRKPKSVEASPSSV